AGDFPQKRIGHAAAQAGQAAGGVGDVGVARELDVDVQAVVAADAEVVRVQRAGHLPPGGGRRDRAFGGEGGGARAQPNVDPLVVGGEAPGQGGLLGQDVVPE